MPAYLKIENVGVCPPEGFTVLGVGLADTSNHEGFIGQFGSGNKHAVGVLLRHQLSPVVFAGNLRLEFSTRPQTVTDGLTSKDFGQVVVKYRGTDPISGASRSSSEDLGFVLNYGEKDWLEVALALREFVSNAIDRSIREKGDWSGVKIEVVDEGQVVATPGAIAALERAKQTVWSLLSQNMAGQWGDLSEDDRQLNNAALKDGSRIPSACVLNDGITKIWCITEAEDDHGNRAATTLLLPDEY